MTPKPFYVSETDAPAKQRILVEGVRLFAAQGLSGTSVRDIAAASGFTNPALYKHFPSKDALATTLFDRCYRQLLLQTRGAVAGQIGFDARFRAYLMAQAEFYDSYPDEAIFLSDNLVTLWPQIAKHDQPETMISLTRALLDAGRAEGAVSAHSDIELQIVVVVGSVAQMCRQLYFKALAGPATSHIDDMERLLKAALR